MNMLTLPKFERKEDKTYCFDVPASKSVAARALLLAALSRGCVRIRHGAFCRDSEEMLSCLRALGVRMEEDGGVLTVYGCGGSFPVKKADLSVGSAGTVARFLPAVLAFTAGEYRLDASEQMKRRPMNFLKDLERAGVQFEYLEKDGSFPFIMRSKGVKHADFTVDTDTSTQFASGLLLAAAAGTPVCVRLTGTRTNSDYLNMTLAVLGEFGYLTDRAENVITVYPSASAPQEYELEADVSGACYFYAFALLFRAKVCVRNVKLNCLQGDVAFLRLLQARGVRFEQTRNGLFADASGVESFAGFNENFQSFSDQTLTAAALAPFASSPTRIRGVGHIRKQECDRLAAIETNLTALGVPARTDGDGVYVQPAPICGGTVRTFGDHRVAMAFALPALKTGGITIDDADCTEKTFRNYFQTLLSVL